MERGGHDYAAVSENTFEERKKIQPSHAIPATRISVPAPPKGPELVNSLSLSLSLAYGRGVEKCHVVALWQCYNDYLTFLVFMC